MELVGFLILFAILLMPYFVPTFVALARGHHQFWPIFVINLFLGWTFIGWVVALAMSVSQVRREIA